MSVNSVEEPIGRIHVRRVFTIFIGDLYENAHDTFYTSRARDLDRENKL
jgi:hypothetical protein